MYFPKYNKSWALIIGINTYPGCPLSFARQDAEAVREKLIAKFGFLEENIFLLVDEEATRSAIMETYLHFSRDIVDDNDRIIVFFAGHGYTQSGKRGEVGYLVPVDGLPDDLSSLIRWDELTRNTDLIRAKHMLFIMDACYGGLAVTRSPGPGSTRFLKDMLQRSARQVITAGKADEQVSDSGGPLPGHSIFTGHLLQGLDGNAATTDGIICANGIMAYVYEKVAKDAYSSQTPHFGFLDGDGDFIFQAPMLDSLESETEKDKDVLIEIPETSSLTTQDDVNNVLEIVKECISNPRYRIRLDEIVTREIRTAQFNLSEDKFPVRDIDCSSDVFVIRLNAYETIIKKLQSISILLSYWGTEENRPILQKIMARLIEEKNATGGDIVCLALRYYPNLILLYSVGIAAISSRNYMNLYAIFTSKKGYINRGDKDKEIISVIIQNTLNFERSKIFKTLPGYDRYYVAKNEYLFKVLQPVIDDLLYLGNSYESMFDRFEVFLALVYIDLNYEEMTRFWCPLGRFAYKHENGGQSNDPIDELLNEAKIYGENWAPLKAGLFSGSYERFQKISVAFEKYIRDLGWH